MTREQLLEVVAACLDEELSVVDPHPFGPDIVVDTTEAGVVVAQPNGPHFIVRVDEAKLEVAG